MKRHWHFRIPRFDGRKTLTFNGLVFLGACGWLTAAYTRLRDFGPVGEIGLYLLALCALLNGLLRLVTDSPVYPKRYRWTGSPLMDYAPPAKDSSVHDWVNDSLELTDDVYGLAADLASHDFTEHKNRVQPRVIDSHLRAVDLPDIDDLPEQAYGKPR